jgi:hypothetical protein
MLSDSRNRFTFPDRIIPKKPFPSEHFEFWSMMSGCRHAIHKLSKSTLFTLTIANGISRCLKLLSVKNPQLVQSVIFFPRRRILTLHPGKSA